MNNLVIIPWQAPRRRGDGRILEAWNEKRGWCIAECLWRTFTDAVGPTTHAASHLQTQATNLVCLGTIFRRGRCWWDGKRKEHSDPSVFSRVWRMGSQQCWKRFAGFGKICGWLCAVRRSMRNCSSTFSWKTKMRTIPWAQELSSLSTGDNILSILCKSKAQRKITYPPW